MRPVLRAGAVGAAALGLVLLVASPASAHDGVVDSTPAEGEVLTEAPAEFSVRASDTLMYVGNDVAFGLWARDASGAFYGDGCATVTGASMTAPAVLGEPGAYTLVAAFISSDGHPTTAEIPFEWAPTGDVEAAVGTPEATRCGEEPAADGAEAPGGGEGVSADVWWIIVAVAAVALAIALTVLLARRRPRSAD